MKRIYSLKGRNLFKEVYLKGRKLQGTGIRLFILKSSKSGCAEPDNSSSRSYGKKIKIAIALTKSFGKAYIRNKTKRRIRAICTQLFDDFKDGFFIIIRIDSDFKDLVYEDQKGILKSLFAQAGLLNSDANKSK
ncbi:MAG: ribonuclease P protein component [Spirochaetes bacterium]|nr:ribonuclease P protein component [Spirochaetota bacterium]